MYETINIHFIPIYSSIMTCNLIGFLTKESTTSEIHYGFTNQGVILSIPSNHDFILQSFLVQYPCGWGSLSLHHTNHWLHQRLNSTLHPHTKMLITFSIPLKRKFISFIIIKKNIKRAGKSTKCAWQFGDEQGVPGHIVPVCLRIMDQALCAHKYFSFFVGKKTNSSLWCLFWKLTMDKTPSPSIFREAIKYHNRLNLENHPNLPRPPPPPSWPKIC